MTKQPAKPKKKSLSRSGGVNISGKAKIGGDVYQADKIGKIDKSKTINKRSGGADITAGGGSTVNITGDVVGRDKITSTTGLTAEEFTRLFEAVYKQIDRLPAGVDKAEVSDAVETIKAEADKEALKGETPTEAAVKYPAQSLAQMAPDILEVVADTLQNPAKGVATIIRKVLAKARGQSSG